MSTPPAFDPDAYLKARAEFDPDKYLAAQAAPPPTPQVGGWETFKLRAAQALPAGGLITDLLSTGAVLALRPKPGAVIPEAAKQELASMGVAVEEPEGALDTYRDIRDTRRLRTAAGSEQNPTPARLGTAAGIATTVAAPWLPKVAVGSGAKGRILSAALTGGAYGGLSGLTDGEADLTRGDVGGAARDTAGGAAFGALLGAGAGTAFEGGRILVGEALRRLALRQGKQAIQGGSDAQAVNRKPLSDESTEEALRAGAIPPLSTTEAIATRLENLVDEQGAVYGEIVAQLEKAGVKGPRVRELADELYLRYVDVYRNSGANKAVANEYLAQAMNLEDVARIGGAPGTPVPQTPGRFGPMGLGGSRTNPNVRERLELRQTERVKQDLQRRARYEKRNNTGTEDALQEIASKIRQANEDAIAEAATRAEATPEVVANAARFVPVKRRLGLLLEAEEAAGRGAAKAEQRSPVSLKDNQAGAAVATATGMPLAYWPTAAVSALVRNRTPATLANGAYSLSEGLRTGSLAGESAGAMAGAAELLGDEVESRADRATIDERTDPMAAALIRALRTKPKPKKKDTNE